MGFARYTLLGACFLAGIMMTGCSDAKSGGKAQEGSEAVAAFTQGKALNASFTDSRVSGMKGVAESEQLRLFIDEASGAIAVLQKRTGEVWYSNPLERSSDKLAAGVNKDLLSAQLKLDFYNSFGQINAINTYTDSVKYKQIKFEPIEGGVSVSYQFGTAQKTAEDLPKMLSIARFEELSGKLDKAGQRALKIAYTQKEDQPAYERNDNALNGLQLERALAAIEQAGYTDEDLQKDMAELNFTQEKPAPRIFQAKMNYTLDGDSLVVHVPVDGIRYPEEYPVNMISVLSFFGAGGASDKGSLFVPDGAGALIHFNNGKTQYPAYQQFVYGADQTLDRTEDASREQEVRLPVFGIIREGRAFLGIIEEGASVATINADIAGRLNGYNYVYPSFFVVNKGEVTLDANGQQRSLPKFQERPMKSDYKVRYAFLSGDEASYTGMARYYRQYLEKNDGLPKPSKGEEPGNAPFYLQLVGGITKKKHVVGIPYKSLEPLTTWEQAQHIVSEMQARDIANIKLRYAGWFNDGLDHKVPDSIKVDGEIGGSKGMRNFIAFAQDKGVGFFPDVALLAANSGSDFDQNKEASRTLRDVPAELYPLDLALNRRDRQKSPSYVISPRVVPDYVDSTLEGLRDYQAGGIALRDLADSLSSDYREGKQIDRTESEGISKEALIKVRDAHARVMASGGNAYALPFLTDLTNAPLSSSGFKLEDEEIPFYPLVVRGYVDYAGAPYNLSTYTNERQYVLKSLEYGANVYFEWIYAPNYKVKDTEYNHLYAVHYGLWIDKAADIYKQVNQVLKPVQGQRIAGHEKLEEGVFKTVYENGYYVIVNYNRASVTVDGKTVEAESYVTGGEQT
ncbi:DUF5696 domain-containing protein [Paenibacillus xanthanilyticus]|uniref:DUF5696 domain-containing protein n=1 Tax=Paenibacillus xanthanilyticus TaxID=1783531 RepID=A0ABV8JVG5_9BACL